MIAPNPKTSGGARWNFLAAWGYGLKSGLFLVDEGAAGALPILVCQAICLGGTPIEGRAAGLAKLVDIRLPGRRGGLALRRARLFPPVPGGLSGAAGNLSGA